MKVSSETTVQCSQCGWQAGPMRDTIEDIMIDAHQKGGRMERVAEDTYKVVCPNCKHEGRTHIV